jgi:hypothetical protein
LKIAGSSRLIAGLSGPLTALSRQALDALIGSFPVPPFLLPIYQAAGIEYGVPWQVLAAINEVETDFGRDLSVSSAGAVGWMQFLPSTWVRWGLDADGRGRANPYDPVDAIFSAARYLAAAGGTQNLPRAIFAYNHANWYVDSVELRARLLQLLPQRFVDGLTGLMEADFPVAGHLGAYATIAPVRVKVAGRPGLELPGPAGAPVIALADGRVVAIGRDAVRGRYITIEDSYGDRYTYEQLGSVQAVYPLVKPRVQAASRTFRVASRPHRLRPGRLFTLPATSLTRARAARDGADSIQADSSATWFGATSSPKQRLFADPARPASYAAGGNLQLQSSVRSYAAATGLGVGSGPADYFSEPLRLKPHQFVLAPLRTGAVVLAGTILGRVARGAPAVGSRGLGGQDSQGLGSQGQGSVTAATTAATAMVLQMTPAGSHRAVDPTPLVAGWKLLGRLTTGHRAAPGLSAGGAYGSTNPSVGQLLLADGPTLQRAVLADPHVGLDGCERAGIAAGAVAEPALALIEYLSYEGLAPTVSGLPCAGGGTSGAAGAAPSTTHLEITALAGVLVAGGQRPGGVVDMAIRSLLALRGALHPARIVSLLSYPWQPTALSLPDHAADLEVDIGRAAPTGARPAPASPNTSQWGRLIGRIDQIGA